MSAQGVFNVEDRSEHPSEFKTTAAQALVDAPAGQPSHTIEKNVNQATAAAAQAAQTAKSLGPSVTGEAPSALESVKQSLSATTNAAVNEGHHDVNSAQAAGTTYIDQAKTAAVGLAATVTDAAKTYLPSSVTGQQSADAGSLPTHTSTTTSTGTTAGAGIVPTIQQYANQALTAAQPTLDRASAAAQPHLEKVFGTTEAPHSAAAPHTTPAQGAHFIGTPASSTGIPATTAAVPSATAPLQSGPHTVGGPYEGDAKKIGENATL